MGKNWCEVMSTETPYEVGPCQCLLVIKERQSLQSSGHDWVLNKRSTECSTGGPVLTGPALRRASRRSHGSRAPERTPPSAVVVTGPSSRLLRGASAKPQMGTGINRPKAPANAYSLCTYRTNLYSWIESNHLATAVKEGSSDSWPGSRSSFWPTSPAFM